MNLLLNWIKSLLLGQKRRFLLRWTKSLHRSSHHVSPLGLCLRRARSFALYQARSLSLRRTGKAMTPTMEMTRMNSSQHHKYLLPHRNAMLVKSSQGMKPKSPKKLILTSVIHPPRKVVRVKSFLASERIIRKTFRVTEIRAIRKAVWVTSLLMMTTILCLSEGRRESSRQGLAVTRTIEALPRETPQLDHEKDLRKNGARQSSNWTRS
ncbi:hypothetical protein BJ166DRAFT_541952 [Pestalotiopsis sp. NC0098]|nr:hypothetical protein BJ166DRAFT_541952 [Pestalotiopsis sp. NC0098]